MQEDRQVENVRRRLNERPTLEQEEQLRNAAEARQWVEGLKEECKRLLSETYYLGDRLDEGDPFTIEDLRQCSEGDLQRLNTLAALARLLNLEGSFWWAVADEPAEERASRTEAFVRWGKIFQRVLQRQR